jgi:hypothetical protein
MDKKPRTEEETTERQPFHFRALMANYDYLCALTQHDRFRSLNLCLNIILTLLRKHDVKSLVELQNILKTRGKREQMQPEKRFAEQPNLMGDQQGPSYSDAG